MKKPNTIVHFVYKTTNLINGKYYVGIHSTSNELDNYLGSGKRLHYAISKYGRDNFKREILCYANSRKHLYELERDIVNIEFISQDDTYNLVTGGSSGKRVTPLKLSAKARAKISKHAKGKVMAIDVTTGDRVKITKDEFDNNPDRYVGHTKGVKVMRTKENKVVLVKPGDTCDGLVGNTFGYRNAIEVSTGNKVHVPVDDPRFSTGELTSELVGYVNMKDALGNKMRVKIDDPRIASGELVGATRGNKYPNRKPRKRYNVRIVIKLVIRVICIDGIMIIVKNIVRYSLNLCESIRS